MKEDADAESLDARAQPTIAHLDTTIATPYGDGKSRSGRLEVRCPSCDAPTSVAADTALTDLTCSNCGSRFSLVDPSEVTNLAPSLIKLGRFELIERLGIGSFGSVWKARDKELDRIVAVKIPRAIGITLEEQEKFFREARAAARLHHPNIVSVHEVGRDGENIYIVSDFVRGVTLRDWLTGQQLTSREAAELCVTIANALHHAHEQGVVHRDVKPANIMIDGDGQPHLMDFGLARREVGEVTMTIEGQILGTPAYMSPEQARGEGHKADRRSDIYSVGVILFQLLTGEIPFRGNSRMLLHQVIHDEPRNPRSLNDRVPRDMDTICVKCLQKELTKRYQTGDELAADIKRFLAHQPIQARPVGRVERCWRWCRRNPVVASLATTIALLLILVALVMSVRNYQAERAYDIAFKAAEEMLTVVGDDLLANVPQMETDRSKLLGDALSAYQQLLDNKPTDIRARAHVADSYYRIGNFQRELGQQTEAANAYERAIDLFNILAEEYRKEPRFLHQKGMAYDYLGETLRDTQKVGEAKDAYSKALEIQRKLLGESPNNPKYEQELSRTRNNFGILLMETDHPKEAESSLQDAISMLTKLSREDPNEVSYQQEFARSNINLGNLLSKEKDREREAEGAYHLAIERLKSVVKKHPDTHAYQCNLAVSLVNFSNFVAEKLNRPADAERQINEAIRQLSDLTKDHPLIPRYRKELANAYNSAANVYAKGGNYPAAEQGFRKALELFETLLVEHEDNAEYQSLTGMVFGCLAELADIQNHHVQAVQFAEQAVKHQQTAVDLNPQHPEYKKRLEGHRDFLTKVKARPQRTDSPKK